MSIPVGTHGLTCLDGDDYSAVPLSLQCNADAIDTSLSGISGSLSAYNNRGWSMLTTTSAVTVSSTTFDFVAGSLPGSYIFSSASSSSQSFGLDTPTVFSTPVLPAGWYMAGCYVSFQATGAVTANSRRNIAIEWSFTTGGVTQHEDAVNMVYESNTGGDAMTVAGMFQADGVTRYNLVANFWHNNTASTVQVNSGAKLWIASLASGLVT